jgi:ribose 1,5-bisphosphokinase
MTWDSHGYRYGVGIEIDAWLARDLTVVVNGSRDYVPAVRARYPQIAVVWISADPAALAARLQQRGRESDDEIAARLNRNGRLGVQPPAGVLRIENDGTLEEAGAKLVALLS